MQPKKQRNLISWPYRQTRLKTYTVVASHKRLNKTFYNGSVGRRNHLSDITLLFYQKLLYLCDQGVKTWLGRGIKSKYKAPSSAPAKAIPRRFLGQITQAVSIEAALFLRLHINRCNTILYLRAITTLLSDSQSHKSNCRTIILHYQHTLKALLILGPRVHRVVRFQYRIR